MEKGEQGERKKLEKKEGEDGSSVKGRKVTSNPIVRILFLWVLPIIRLGKQRPLQMEDLWLLSPGMSTHGCYERFSKKWGELKQIGRSSVTKSVLSGLYPKIFLSLFLHFIYITMQFVNPFVQRLLVDYLDDSEQNVMQGIIYLIILFVASFIGSTCTANAMLLLVKNGMKVRSSLMAAVYAKALRLSPAAKQNSSTGEIVNLMSNDAQKIVETVMFINMGLFAPIQLIGILIFLYFLLGPFAFVALGVMIAVVPFNSYIAKKFIVVRKKILKQTDERIKLTNEIIQAIRILKYYSWEEFFMHRVMSVREEELKGIRSFNFARMWLFFIMITTPTLSSTLTFLVYSLAGNDLDPAVVFPALTLLNLLRIPLIMLPMVVNILSQNKVAFDRINKFLEAEDLPQIKDDLSKEPGVIVSMENASFSWTKDAENPTLTDLTFDIKKGDFVMIIGKVGSGKSSVLSAILGEMYRQKGKSLHPQRINYSSQQAWILNASLKDNILFGNKYDENKYQAIIEACSLSHDLELLPAGDATEIGERGINLSGGQKQRLSIARTIYNDSCDIFLFDDPLSAVDAHVGKHIFENVLQTYLADKTRILVTNQLQYVHYAGKILYIADGKLQEQGNYDDLMQKNGEFARLINSETSFSVDRRNEAKEEKSMEKKKDKKKVEKSGDLVKQEERDIGKVGWNIYRYFLISGGGMGLFTLIILLYAFNILFTRIGSDFWLSVWSEDGLNRSNEFYLIIYACWTVIDALSAMIVGSLFVLLIVRASRVLHNNLLNRILHAPTSFFDVTPLGRILNRFSKDQDVVDSILGGQFQNFIRLMFTLLGTAILIVIASYYLLAIIIPAMLIYYFMQNYYKFSARELQRLDSVSRSPIFQHFSETLGGLSVIRAFKREKEFFEQNKQRIDQNNRAFFSLHASNVWMSLYLDWLSAIVVAGIVGSIILFPDSWPIGLAGLALTYSFNLTGVMNMTARTSAETESKMNAVERIFAYSNVPTELDPQLEDAPENWPSSGEIAFSEVKFSYRPELDPVFHSLSFVIHPKEKIGIVGRTGSGKSSLMVLLFRLVNVTSGRILIDSIDIASVTLHSLRSKLAIIPQEPVLFTGSIRTNLDPFHQYSDEDLWRVLEQAQLKSVVEQMPDKLDAHVQENGENFSVGQRQLICLARALLRKPKILVLDEATASVDSETDSLIQKTVRSEFQDCTVLTIAHRINTIMDSDRIMVLENGNIAEFGPPEELLQDTHGIFWSLVRVGDNNLIILEGQ